MKKSNQFSNKLIARKDLINSISAASAFLIVIFGILMYLFVLSPEQDINGKIVYFIQQRFSYPPNERYIFSSEGESTLLLGVAGGLALGISQFEFLHRKKYCSTLLSFGIKRNKLFLSRLIIPLVFALLCILAPYLIALKFNIETFGLKPEMFSYFFFELIRVIRVFLTSYTISIFSCMFTGRTIEAAASAISLAALPSTIMALYDIVWGLSLYGYPGMFYSQTSDILAKADPTFLSSLLYSREFVHGYLINTTPNRDNIIQIVFSLAWIIISFATIAFLRNYFSKKFKPENSGFKGINKGIVAIISFTAPLLFSSVVIERLTGEFYPITSQSIAFLVIAIGVAAGLIASIICGLVIHLTNKKLKTSAIGGFALIGTIGIVLILGMTGIFGTYHNIPEAEEISKIEIKAPFHEFFPDTYEHNADFTQQYMMDTHTALVITDKDDIETVLNLHKTVSQDNENATTSSFDLTYILKDGSAITREYKYPGADATKEILKLWDTKAAKEMYKNFFFPKSNGPENLDYAPTSMSLLFEQPYIMDYNDENAYILINTRERGTKSVLDEISEAEFIKLKKAIYKDICTLDSSQWFTPEEAQIGSLTFCLASYQRFSIDSSGANFYINPDMTNTIKALKDMGLYKYFEGVNKIEKVFVADIKEYMAWENGPLNSNKKNVAVHQPYFTYMDNGWSYVCFESYERGEYIPPVKEVTDKLQIKSLTEKGFIAYNIMNNGKIVFVKYTDGTCSSYVIPYEQ